MRKGHMVGERVFNTTASTCRSTCCWSKESQVGLIESRAPARPARTIAAVREGNSGSLTTYPVMVDTLGVQPRPEGSRQCQSLWTTPLLAKDISSNNLRIVENIIVHRHSDGTTLKVSTTRPSDHSVRTVTPGKRGREDRGQVAFPLQDW
jgi:hypothetical protein